MEGVEGADPAIGVNSPVSQCSIAAAWKSVKFPGQGSRTAVRRNCEGAKAGESAKPDTCGGKDKGIPFVAGGLVRDLCIACSGACCGRGPRGEPPVYTEE